MKKIYINIVTIIFLLAFAKTNAQTTSTFENVTLAADTFKNGSDRLGGFTSGNAFFVNNYDTVYQSWDGFSISDKKDSTTAGWGNQYSAITATGNNSSNYAVAYYSGFNALRIKLNGSAKGKQLSGFYITNSTYAYLAMKNGSTYNKKFGGSTGNDSDWLKLSINGYKSGGQPADSTVDFYLADFRFSDNTKDYFIKTWTWIDLKKLGNVDSIDFILSSTDTAGGFGMNNPAYFCLDNFTTRDLFTEVKEIKFLENIFLIYPNPAISSFTIKGLDVESYISIFDLAGKEIFEKSILKADEKISIENLKQGIYFVQLKSSDTVQIKKLIIE